jgi:hypothetical protein
LPLFEISSEIEVVIYLPPLWLQVFKRAFYLNRFRVAPWYRADCKNGRAFRVASDAPAVYLNRSEYRAQSADNGGKMLFVAWLAVWLSIRVSVVLSKCIAWKPCGFFQPSGIDQRADFGE